MQLFLGLLGVSIIGCADLQLPTTNAHVPTDARVPSANRIATKPTEEQAALQDLARAVALALSEPGTRLKVLTDMQKSTVREHKLALNVYLTGQVGQQLLNAAAAATSRTPSDLLELVNRIRPLEFYMPVTAHRRTWKGGREVLVAAQLKAEDTPLGFSVTGESVVLSPTRAPDAPTLALVPVETNFGPQIATSTASRLLRAPPGAASFTIEPPPSCDPECPPPPPVGGIPTTAPSGLYMTYTDLYDAAEPWIRGSPEVEAHILGPAVSDSPTSARQISCSGEHAPNWRSFDQNGNQWSGAVLLLSESEMVARGYVTGTTQYRGFSVVLYEDDDESCVIHDDNARLRNDLSSIGLLGGLGAGIAITCSTGFCFFSTVFVTGIGIIDAAIHLFQTNDDYLGVAVPRANASQYTNPAATHTLVKHQNAINGGIKLVYHVYGQ